MQGEFLPCNVEVNLYTPPTKTPDLGELAQDINSVLAS